MVPKNTTLIFEKVSRNFFYIKNIIMSFMGKNYPVKAIREAVSGTKQAN